MSGIVKFFRNILVTLTLLSIDLELLDWTDVNRSTFVGNYKLVFHKKQMYRHASINCSNKHFMTLFVFLNSFLRNVVRSFSCLTDVSSSLSTIYDCNNSSLNRVSFVKKACLSRSKLFHKTNKLINCINHY